MFGKKENYVKSLVLALEGKNTIKCSFLYSTIIFSSNLGLSKNWQKKLFFKEIRAFEIL